jgi:hypothetical protein
VDVVGGTAVSPDWTDLTLGNHTISAVYGGDGNFNGSTATSITQNVVVGSRIVELTPTTGGTMTYTTQQGGVDVTTTVEIPAGAVSEDVTLVFTWMNASTHTPPAGNDFVVLFKLEAYINGVLQNDFEFQLPVTVAIDYNSKNWDENTFNPFVWDGTDWSSNGLAVSLREPEVDKITFTLTQLAKSEFVLAGVHQYSIFMPITPVN